MALVPTWLATSLQGRTSISSRKHVQFHRNAKKGTQACAHMEATSARLPRKTTHSLAIVSRLHKRKILCGCHEFRTHLHHEVVDTLVSDLRGGCHGGSPAPQRDGNEGRFPHHTFCCAYQPLPEHRWRACCERGSSCSCAQTATEDSGCGDLAVRGDCSGARCAVCWEGSTRDTKQEYRTRWGRRQHCHDHNLYYCARMRSACLLVCCVNNGSGPRGQGTQGQGKVCLAQPRGCSPSP